MIKRNISLVPAILLAFTLLAAGCGSDGDEAASESSESTVSTEESATTDESTATDDSTATDGAAGSDFSFALVLPNRLGDRSFIDSANRGAERAMEEFGVEGVVIETNGVAEHESAMRAAIGQEHDLVMGLAMDAELLVSLAGENPEQLMGSPSDVFADELPDNLAAFTINVHESSYLVGVVAGSMTRTNKVGAVVGGDAPGLNQFYWGYKQGVLSVCPDCEVEVSYLGFEFGDPALGLETARAQYESGVDIIYQVAGLSGEGVLEAAAQTGNYAIGVDSNQDDLQPGSVIVSMIKRTDATTYELIRRAFEGDFTGGFNVLNLADGAAGLSWDDGSTTFADNGPAELTALLPDVQAAVEAAREQILGGEVEVCDALNVTAACDGLS
jgi:basic membrane protein A